VTGATRPASQREVEQGTLAHSKMLGNWGTIYARSLCSVAVIAFAPLSSIDPREMLALLTDPRVLRHLPLAGPEPMRPDEVSPWVAGKEAITKEHGYGPKAILIDGTFAGWGGLVPDEDGVDIALVLLPAFWGWGLRVLKILLGEAFGQLRLPYVLVHFPPSRTRIRGLLSLGFRRVGEEIVEAQRWVVYRLDAPPS
jgi:Acetyltransferase (GNAT) domain